MEIHIKNNHLLIKVVLVCLVVYDVFRNYTASDKISLVIILNYYIRPLILIYLIFISKKIIDKKLNFKFLVGIFSSFVAVYLFKADNVFHSLSVWLAYYAIIIFFSILMLSSLLSLGSSFSIFPSLNRVISAGPYSYVRHPIYTSYLLYAFSFVVVYPRFLNFLAFILLYLGLMIRIFYEEKELEADPTYLEYKNKVKHRVLSWPLLFPVITLCILVQYENFNSNTFEKRKIVNVISSTNLQILNPLYYDEWGTVFIGNHIFPRLISQADRDGVDSISSSYKNECIEEVDGRCLKNRLFFSIKKFTSCSGKDVGIQNFQYEIKRILEDKNWIFPNWSFCKLQHDDKICIEVSGVSDIDRRLNSIYLRFGWSIFEKNDELIGLSPYCLKKNLNTEGVTLFPKKENLPTINFRVDPKGSSNFDLSLYDIEVKNNEYKKLITHTPAAYYIILNKKYTGSEKIFLNDEFINYLKKSLNIDAMEIGMDSAFDNLLPLGTKESDESKSYSKIKFSLTQINFIIPDFIDSCSQTKNELKNYLSQRGYNNVNIRCENLATFIPNQVLKGDSWDVFVTPLTPGGPFRGAISEQYFSKKSKDSWISKGKQTLFRRVALIITNVIVSNKVCFIKPNPLGVSDLFISDLVFCDADGRPN